MTFGERLKAERERKKLSRTDLSKKIKVHYTQIGRYERNEANPTADILKRLANELDISTDYLMNGTRDDMIREKIKDKSLLNQFNRIIELDEENQKIVTALIDAFLFKQEMKNKLTS